MKDACNSEYLEAILDDLIGDMAKLVGRLRHHDKKLAPEMVGLERYICQNATELLIRLFERPTYSHHPFMDIKVHQKESIIHLFIFPFSNIKNVLPHWCKDWVNCKVNWPTGRGNPPKIGIVWQNAQKD